MDSGVNTVSDGKPEGENGPMTVERWTPQRRRELTRTALLEAASLVFARRGFHGASLDEIAETAGFTRGAIYKNFEDKEGLFLATVDRHVQFNLAAFSEHLELAAEQGIDTASLAVAWRQILGRDPDWFALDLEARLYALRNPGFRTRYAEHHRALTEAVAKFIEDLSADAGLTLRFPVDRLASIVEVASEGFMAWSYLDPDEGDLFASFFEVLWSAIVEPS
jgi:AcrR family transcriptional regulator